MRIVFVSTWPPRRCGIATFTSDLRNAVMQADPTVRCEVAAIDERLVVRAYGPEVKWRIQQGSREGYAMVANSIAVSDVDAVVVEHEFGLYGLWPEQRWDDGEWVGGGYEDHLTAFLEEVKKPVLVTMHTVLPEPSDSLRESVRRISMLSDGLVVQAETAVGILREVYGVEAPITVIQHGMPHIEPRGRRKLKEKMGLVGRSIISTFGLVGPGKGLEYVIEAMPAVAAKHPEALYLVAGQTHPELLRNQGEEYRNGLMKTVEALEIGDHVRFINEYLAQEDLIDLLLASDVYVTPYLDPNQITSGTLSYALGAGKAVVSTPYLHAKEALADERGLLVEFRSSESIAGAINRLLDDAGVQAGFEQRAYAYANEFTWPKVGRRILETVEALAAAAKPRPRARRRPGVSTAVPMAKRLKQNPLIRPEDVAPSHAGLEVTSTINAGIARVGDEVVALVRVAERPIPGGPFPPGAMQLRPGGGAAGPKLSPLPDGAHHEDFVGVPFIEADGDGEPRMVLAFVPKDLPGLDLEDPRSVRWRDPKGDQASADLSQVDYLTQVSHLRLARSEDGIAFTVDPQPTIMAGTPLEEYGVEDARVTEIDGQYLITYVSVSRLGIATSLIRTADFVTFEREGPIFLPDQKDVVLFPGRVDGRYLAFTRPMPASFGHVLGIWLAESPDLVHWGRHRPVALPRPGKWDEARIGASLTPIRVPEGWLELYHGADRTNRYGMGGLLLDAQDPSKVLARSPRPLLVPEVDYERQGLLNDVVFPSGHIVLEPGKIRVYYGGADTFLNAADFSIDRILGELEPC